uniref:uncharacterized protein LOC122587788 n=1 Tax=Erigeron canadensis TaxID=72917 RepID=UPI001CB8B0F9|nr:uncharacterized protein LOC122587788 [Erigeron canadensis]
MLAYPVVEYFVKTNWKKFGLQKVMMNANDFFFFKFTDKAGMHNALDGGPWFIRGIPLFLKLWSPTVKLQKQELKEVAVWIKIHNVPIPSYSDDGLSLLASKLGTPKMLDAYTSSMCTDAWGRISYAGALIKISAKSEYKNELSIAIPEMNGAGYTKELMKVEYEWKPPRCSHCCVFGHLTDQCPKCVKAPASKKEALIDEDGFQMVKNKGKSKEVFHPRKPKHKLVYVPVSKTKETIDTTGTSKAMVNTKNSYELLNEYGEESKPLFQPITDISQCGKLLESLKGVVEDEFDADVDEYIEIHDETTAFMSSGTTPLSHSEGASTPVTQGSNG